MDLTPRYDKNGAVAGIAVGLCVAAQYAGGKIPTIAGIAAVVAVLYINKAYLRRCFYNVCGAPPYCGMAVALCVANIVIMGLQAHREGMHAFGVASQMALGMATVAVVCVYLFREPTPNLDGLMVIATGIAVLAGANLVAEKLGFAKDDLLDRETFFTSNFEEGRFRWQSPLISSWQLSGLLRWAVPVLFVYAALQFRVTVAYRLFLLCCGALGAYVAILCEYRAALIPLLGAFIWLTARVSGLRNGLSVCFVVYPVAALFIFTSDESYYLLQQIVPEEIYVLTGSQSVEGVLSLSGRSEMWAAGMEGLAAGKHLLVGTGHFGLDARNYGIETEGGLFSAVVSKISFHNALLDHLYIYGVAIGLLLLAIFAAGVWRLFVLAGAEPNCAQRDAVSFALFTVGMLGLANCHDGFLTSHNIFYLIVAAAFRLAEPTSKTLAGYASSARPQYQ